MLFKSGIFTVLILIQTFLSYGQEGGNSVYKFLNLTNSARVAALGGNMLAVRDNDLNLVFHNPSLLNSSMDNHFVLNYVNYFIDINYGYVGYAKSYGEIGNFSAGLHYINYGDFDRTDDVGNFTGKFKASEYAFNLIFSKPIDSLFSFGINLKPVFSEYDIYKSFGLVADLGVSYVSKDQLFAAALVFKNVGSQIKPYRENNFEPIPFEIQAGISQKLAHAPFRLSLVVEHLEKYDLTYEIPVSEVNNLFADNSVSKTKNLKEHADKIARHIVLGVEILPMPNFYVNLGYNYRRRQELKIDTRSFTTGFSWGFGVKVSKFRFSYGRATYHLAGATNHFSLSTNLSEFYRKSN